MKITILGYSGSGKSTIAKYISEYYNIPLLYLDTVQFESNWSERNREEAISIVSEFMQNNEWVIDGNYTSFLQERRLQEADYIVYLRFSRLNCLVRAYRRYKCYRNTTRESITSGCVEKLDLEFIWWILYQGRTREKRQHDNCIIKTYRDKVIVLKNQKELNRFRERLFDGYTQ